MAKIGILYLTIYRALELYQVLYYLLSESLYASFLYLRKLYPGGFNLGMPKEFRNQS